MNYMTIKWPDIANGLGTRISLFVSGCHFHCKGCFNEETWPFDAGKPYTYDIMAEILNRLDDTNCSGLTVLGGEPMHPKNIEDVSELLMQAKYMHPEKLTWVYTGYTLESLLKRTDEGTRKALRYTDVLVDGPFVLSKHEILPFRGSSNQRIIDMKKTRHTGYTQIVPYEWD